MPWFFYILRGWLCFSLSGSDIFISVNLLGKNKGKIKKQLSVNDKPMLCSRQQYSRLINPLFSTLENTILCFYS